MRWLGRRKQGRHVGPSVVAGALVLLAVSTAACGSSGQTVPRSSILRAHAATRTVDLLLVSSSDGADGGFNFDGYGDGAMSVSIPIGWSVHVTCKNASSDLAHSCAVVDLPLSPSGAPVAFAGASSPDPKLGVQPGNTLEFTFVASRVGVYRLACLVSGHEMDGMWDWFTVTPGGMPELTTH